MGELNLSDSDRRRILATVIACISVVGLSLGLTIPLVSITLEQRGVDSTLIGAMAAMPAVGILVVSPLVPALVKRSGPRGTLFLGIGLAGSSVFALSFFDNIWVWLALRFVMGAADASLFIVSETWINQVAREHNRGRLIALYATTLSLCMAVGPVLIAFTGTEGPLPFVVAAMILCASVIPVLGMGDRLPRIEGSATFSVFRFFHIAPTLSAGVLLFAFIDGAGMSMLPVFGLRNGYPEAIAAVMVTVLIAGNVALQIPFGWLADHMDRHRLLLILGCFVLVGSLALPMVVGVPSLLWPLLFVLGAVAAGVYTVPLIIVGQRFKSADLVAANAAIGVIWGIGNLIGPVAAGVAMRSMGANGLPITFAAATALFLGVFVVRHARGRARAAPVTRREVSADDAPMPGGPSKAERADEAASE